VAPDVAGLPRTAQWSLMLGRMFLRAVFSTLAKRIMATARQRQLQGGADGALVPEGVMEHVLRSFLVDLMDDASPVRMGLPASLFPSLFSPFSLLFPLPPSSAPFPPTSPLLPYLSHPLLPTPSPHIDAQTRCGYRRLASGR
jgi:hypothetical protein